MIALENKNSDSIKGSKKRSEIGIEVVVTVYSSSHKYNIFDTLTKSNILNYVREYYLEKHLFPIYVGLG